jgi:hypothetical protein
MYLNPDKVFRSEPSCKNNGSHVWRYKSYPHGCVECVRERQGTTVDRRCDCGELVPRGVNGNRRYCDACLEYRTSINRYWHDHPEKAKAYQKAYDRFRQSGFTQEMFYECWKLQNGLCGLCSINLETLDSTHVHADHEPESSPKRPRGILCRKCNTYWLGKLEAAERAGDCKITNPQLIEWQTNPPMARSSFAEELGWLVCA